MNIDDYRKRKKDKKISVVRLAKNTIQVISKKYNPNTGEEVNPEKIVIELSSAEEEMQNLLSQKDKILARIEELGEIIKDIKK